MTYTALGQSDTFISLPVHRKEAFVGKVASVSGTNNEIVKVQGTPGWADDDFVYSVGVQPDTFYAMITDGDSAGRYWEILDNAGSAVAGESSITLDVAGEDITGNVGNGTGIKIIPFWTLNTLMPGGQGIHASTSHAGSQRKSEIIIPSSAAGINLASGLSYYYYSGTAGAGPGWRQAGGGISNIKNDDTLAPDLFFIVRHNVSTGGLQPQNDGRTEITPIGTVFNNTYRTLVNVQLDNTDQDNAIGLTVPVEVTLNESNIWESGAFVGSTSHAGSQRQDQILVFDNSVAAKNKAATFSYYYYSGAAGAGPGWRRAGGGISNIVNDVIFSIDKTVIIRKKGVVAGSVIWDMTPSYLPLP